MKYYHVAESTFVRAKSIKDGLRILDRFTTDEYTASDFYEVSADDVHNVHDKRISLDCFFIHRGYFKLYFDIYYGIPKRAIMDCSRDADIIY